MFFLRSEAEGGFNSDQIEKPRVCCSVSVHLMLIMGGGGSKELYRQKERISTTAC